MTPARLKHRNVDSESNIYNVLVQSAVGKGWRLYILPQYLANLTQPMKHKKANFFYNICCCTEDIV